MSSYNSGHETCGSIDSREIMIINYTCELFFFLLARDVSSDPFGLGMNLTDFGKPSAFPVKFVPFRNGPSG